MTPWVYLPHSGGIKITALKQWQIVEQAKKFMQTRAWSTEFEVKLRFRGQFCYVDGLKRGESRAFPLCRLRYFGDFMCSMALYAYSSDRYEACIFPNGSHNGTVEEAIKVSEVYLN